MRQMLQIFVIDHVCEVPDGAEPRCVTLAVTKDTTVASLKRQAIDLLATERTARASAPASPKMVSNRKGTRLTLVPSGSDAKDGGAIDADACRLRLGYQGALLDSEQEHRTLAHAGAENGQRIILEAGRAPQAEEVVLKFAVVTGNNRDFSGGGGDRNEPIEATFRTDVTVTELKRRMCEMVRICSAPSRHS